MDPPAFESINLLAALDAMPQPGWLCDRRGRIVHANERWLAYLGGESRLRRNWLVERFLHAHDIAEVRARWHHAFDTGREFAAQARLRRFDDTWRWHQLHAVPVTHADGTTTTGWLGTWTDVDDSIAELETLRLRTRLLESQAEASLDATILTTPDRRLVWANRRAYELWGVRRDEYPPGSDLRSASERLAGRVRDQRRHRQSLEVMYDRARAAIALDYVADAVFLVDLHDVVHLWNPAAELLTGIRANDAVERRIMDLLVDWEAAMKVVPVLEGVDVPRASATVPLEVAGGREAWVSAVGVRFDDGVVYALRDVTDDQRLDRMRSDIVATVSHELRTPLTSIYGMAITLHDSETRLDDETRRRLLATIVEQSARLGSIVDDLLVADGLDSGAVTLRSGVVDIDDVVRRAVEQVAREIDVPNPITVEFESDLPHATADAGRMQQVLVSLLENAVKYSPDGGAVCAHVRRSGTTDVAIDVIDEGIGIPEDEFDDVFEKFHRLDPSMVLGIAGTGLGLYIARELARRMGGDVTVDSIEGSGSTFTLVLPSA